jgi:hypothetical protein
MDLPRPTPSWSSKAMARHVQHKSQHKSQHTCKHACKHALLSHM